MTHTLPQPEALEQRRDLTPRMSPAPGLQQLQCRVVERADTRQQVKALPDEPKLGEPEMEASRSDSDATSRPPIRTVPAVGSSSIAIINNNVVLPEPLGPYNATVSPGATVNDTPSTARTGSPPSAG